MQYPKPLERGSRVAITALSSSVEMPHRARFAEIIRTLRERGYEIIFGECLYGEQKNASASKEKRSAELQRFLLDDSIAAIAPPWGGELAIELLPLLDWQAIAQAKPKWLFGFSDVSTIAAPLACKLGWASVHSSNLMDLIDTATEPLISQTLNWLEQGTEKTIDQQASLHYVTKWPNFTIDPLSTIVGDTPTQWQWLVPPTDQPTMRGRLLGGCWDTLIHLFATPYLDLARYKENHRQGLLLYLENAEMTATELVRAIHNMQFRGVFEVINGLILGRNAPIDRKDKNQLHYQDVLQAHLSNKGIPVLIDADIGHVPPNLTLINGALAEVGINHGRGFITQWLD